MVASRLRLLLGGLASRAARSEWCVRGPPPQLPQPPSSSGSTTRSLPSFSSLSRSWFEVSKIGTGGACQSPKNLQVIRRHYAPKRDCVDVRQGNKILRDGKLYEIVKFEHTRGMARQTGNVQLELRELSRGGGRGNKSTMRVKPGHALEVVRLDEKKFRVLYVDGDVLQVMNETTFDQVELPIELFEGQVQMDLAKESTFMESPPEVTVLYHGEDALSCKLPTMLDFVVDKSFMGASKQSATAREKDSYLPGGTIVKVPDHVEKGDTVVVDTRDGSFVKKAT